MTQPSSRDLELLSTYLDGQLSKADAARLEARIKNDPELRSAYDGLRQTRALLRQLPARRAPRNFRLTPQMVGVKPSMPRSFPVFRLASILATVLLFLGYAINLSAAANPMAAATSMAYDTYMAPAATAPVEMATDVPSETTATTEPPQAAAKLIPTETPEAATTLSQQDTVTPESRSMAPSIENTMPVAPPQPALPIHPGWLYGLLGLATFSGATAFIVRLRTEQRFDKTRKLTTKDMLMIVLAIIAIIVLATGIFWMSVGQ